MTVIKIQFFLLVSFKKFQLQISAYDGYLRENI